MLSWLPENVSTYGADIDALFYLIYYIVGAAFLLTEGALLLFLILYRRREGQRATYVSGERRGEAAWILVPCLIVLVLDLWIDVRGEHVWSKVKMQVPPADFQLRVTGKQFNWETSIPGQTGSSTRKMTCSSRTIYTFRWGRSCVSSSSLRMSSTASFCRTCA